MRLEVGEIGLKSHIRHKVSVLRHEAGSIGQPKAYNGGVVLV